MNKLNEQYFETRQTHKRKFNKYGWIIWISIFGVFLYSVVREVQSQLNNKISLPVEIQMKNCLSANEFKFGQIDYKQNPTSIIDRIGRPDSVFHDIETNSELWFYKDIEIGITNNHIYYLWVKDSTLSTPSGIKIGLTRQDVNERLQKSYSGSLHIDSTANNIQIVNCETEFYLIMDFEIDKLVKLEMGIDLP